MVIFSGRRLTGPPSEAPESFSSLRAATYANVLPSSCPLKLEHFSVLFEIWCILIYLIFTTHPRCNTFGHFFFFYLFHCRRWATGSERPAKNNKRRRTSDPSNRRLTVVSSSPPVDLQPAHRLRTEYSPATNLSGTFFLFFLDNRLERNKHERSEIEWFCHRRAALCTFLTLGLFSTKMSPSSVE